MGVAIGWRRWVAGAVVLAAAGLASARQDGSGFTRVKEGDDGTSVRLEMGVREFASETAGRPRIFLAAAVHIGEAQFYHDLQDFLDGKDVVLFEGVKPPGAGSDEHEAAAVSDEEKKDGTVRRVRFIAMAVERYKNENKKLPADLKELVNGSGGRIGSLLKGAMKDAWGRELEYSTTAPDEKGESGFDVVSLGADGKTGGDGAAADIRFADQKPLSKPEKGDKSEGIQGKLAGATGLVFQLNEMNSDKPNWRNSDLSIDQVQARLEKAGADGSALFTMLDGSSMFSKVGGALLGMIGSSPEGKGMLRLMMIEMLGHAEALLHQAPGGMGKMMDVILEDRNQVVIADLKKVVETEPGVKSIAIIYGAGHLSGIQKGIEAMGYAPVGETWRTAMRVDAKAAGLSEAQFKSTRAAVGRMAEGQMKKKEK